ncbi:MAG: GAF domain-containing protein [Xenococcaceae cyanobacterium]
MINPKNRLFCRLDGLTPEVRDQQRLATLKSLGLLEAQTPPVFDEATQTAARFIEAPICILGLMVQEELWLKSAIGLSRLGLMNQLAALRRIPRQESFCTYVVDSQQNLTIDDTTTDPVFALSTLVQHHGIRAYLGTPLLTAAGQCIGTLAVMDLVPRQFTTRDVEFLALTARWCLREFERNHLLKTQQTRVTEPLTELLIPSQYQQGWEPSPPAETQNVPAAGQTFLSSTNGIKVRLLEQLTEELRTPLTSVIGMASVLIRQVYGTLTNKQKEYLEIIHTSGQHMISLVEEIVNLGILDDNTSKRQLTSVDIEMLCQQVLNSLFQVAKHQKQELRLSVEPGNRIWLLDKEKVRQALYYLVVSVIESSEAGGEVRIHVSRRSKTLNIAVWISHPWLGDGLPQVKLYSRLVTNLLSGLETSPEASKSQMSDSHLGNQILKSSDLAAALNKTEQLNKKSADKSSRELLGLLLSCHLAEIHGGKIIVQGSPESGYRYVLTLPKIAAGGE